MSKSKLIGVGSVFILGTIGALVFFQDQVMTYLINPIADVFTKIWNVLPIILAIGGGVMLVSALVSKRRRFSYLIIAALCFIGFLAIGEPNGLQSLVNFFNIITGGRPKPDGWH